MLLYKRLIYIVFIVVLISVGFLFLNNMIYRTDHSISNRYEDEDIRSKLQSAQPMANGQVRQMTILYSEDTPIERLVCDNICEVCGVMKAPYELRLSAGGADLENTDILVIACREFTDKISPRVIADFVAGGGDVLFAVGLSEETTASYLYPVWGLMEKGSLYDAKGMEVKGGFLPSGELSFTESVLPMSCTSVRLKDGCEVYVRAGDGNPIIWMQEYRGGRVSVINCNMMEDRAAAGFFTAALAAVEDIMVYPVLGTKAVFLDGFPPGEPFSSEELLDFYGRSSSAFVRDILWPDLLKTSLDDDLKYTAVFMGLSNYDTANRMLNESEFAYNAKEIIRYAGEMAVGGDYSRENHDYTGIEQYVHGVMTTIFKEYDISCFAPVYGKLTDADMAQLKKTFADLKVIRGTYFGDEKTQEVQTFGMKDGLVTYPFLTSGFELTERNRLEYYSMLTTYGAIAHAFNMQSLINPGGPEDNWENIDEEYEKLCDEFFGESGWLSSVTASEGARHIETYSLLGMEVSNQEGLLRVACSDFVSGQVFMARSEKPLIAVLGCSVEALGENYYKVTAEEPYFEIKAGD